MENDYKNSVIYRIYCKNPDITECYIGSTIDLYNRFKAHKACVNNRNLNNYNLKIYQFIREKDLKIKEQEYISRFKPTLNTNNAYTSEEVKIEQKQKRDKKYRESGKGKEKERKYTEKLMNDPERYKQKLKNKSEWGKKPKYCEICNRIVTNDGWSHHKKTKLHLENVEKN
jgi:hypothetical protein